MTDLTGIDWRSAVAQQGAAALPTKPAAQNMVLPAQMPFALQLYLNDQIFDRCKLIAKYMAEAEGITPQHLIGKTAACFAVVTRALTWKLDPFAVAQCTYQTPGGKVGYEGKLIQAILENSGRLENGLDEPEYYGDWTKIQGKFRWETSQKGHRYGVPAWNEADEVSVGVIIRAQIIGEKKPRQLRFDLMRAQPRNSTLWAFDPMTQIWYTGVRRFGNVACPGLVMGVPWDREEDGAQEMVDITPARPTKASVAQQTMDAARDSIRPESKVEPTAVQEAEQVQTVTETKPAETVAAEPQKRHRRTKAEMEAARAAEAQGVDPEPPLSLNAEPVAEDNPEDTRVISYTIIDLDGKDLNWEDPNDAALVHHELCAILVEAAQRGPDVVAGFRETNAGLIDELKGMDFTIPGDEPAKKPTAPAKRAAPASPPPAAPPTPPVASTAVEDTDYF